MGRPRKDRRGHCRVEGCGRLTDPPPPGYGPNDYCRKCRLEVEARQEEVRANRVQGPGGGHHKTLRVDQAGPRRSQEEERDLVPRYRLGLPLRRKAQLW